MKKYLLVLLVGRNLTDLWLVLPPRLFTAIQRRLGITDEALHEWLCEALGCRCPDWLLHPTKESR